MSSTSRPVTIVGAGIAGAACAAVLRDAGVPFRLIDRGRAVGGRMASPELHGRRVDIGAGYFTVRDAEFEALVGRWESAGLARPWTDTFGVLSPGATPETSTGPVRWSTPNGLRSLVRDILVEVPSDTEELTTLPDGDVVIAMPDPQAGRLTTVPDTVSYDPAITVALGFDAFTLPFDDAAFVNNDPVLEFLADDGARRGDGAAVLVAHTTAKFARKHLEDPPSAAGPVIDAVHTLIGSTSPTWTHVHRWTYAKPSAAHDTTFGVLHNDSRTIYLAGDQWSPSGPPRIESAWRSGTDAGRAVLEATRR